MLKLIKYYLFVFSCLCFLNVNAQVTLLYEDFESGFPASWNVVKQSGDTMGWQVGTSAELSSLNWPIDDNGGKFAASNDDSCDCDKSSTLLITPSINLSAFDSAVIEWDAFYDYSSDDAAILVSIDDGATWPDTFYIGTDPSWYSWYLTLEAYVGNANVKCGFLHNDYGAWGYGYAVDNIEVTGFVGASGTMVYIPDSNFRYFLNYTYSSCMVGDSLSISCANVQTGTLDCAYWDIEDLTGVEHFTNIDDLWCEHNKLTSVPDISSMSNLITFDCSANQLTALPTLPSTSTLTHIYCADNQLTTLPNLSGLTGLTYIDAENNKLSSLPDLSGLSNLNKLYIGFNELPSIPNLPSNLYTLSCINNKLTSLGTLPTGLVNLYAYNNMLTSLPTLPTGLVDLYADNNLLTSLPALPANIEVLDVYNNELTSLPTLPGALTFLWVSGNDLTALPDMFGLGNLVTIYCNSNKLTSIPDLPNQIENIWCDDNQINTLPDLSGATNLLYLSCSNNKLTSLPDLSNCTLLDELSVDNNLLASLPNLSNNTNLTEVHCEKNKLDFSDADELLIIDSLDLNYLDDFTYYPQNPFGNKSTQNFQEGTNGSISITAQEDATAYQWFKNGVPVSGATSTTLSFNNIQTSSAGKYTCKSYGSSLLWPPMFNGPGVNSFISEPIDVVVVLQLAGTIYHNTTDSTIDKGKVYLYHYNSEVESYTLKGIDTLSSGGAYQFNNVTPGQYILLAKADTGMYKSAFPTYKGNNGNKYRWLDCQPLSVNTSMNNVDITVVSPAQQNGSGRVYGFVIGGNKSGKVEGPGDPLGGMDVSLIDKSTSNPVAHQQTADSGNFNMTQIEQGEYFLNVEVPGIPQSDLKIQMDQNTAVYIIFVVDSTGISYNATTTVNASVLNLENTMQVFVYPNPNEGVFNISFEQSKQEDVVVEIYNIVGEVVHSYIERNVMGYYNKKIALPGSDGTYLLRISSGDKRYYNTIIKQ